METPAFDDPCDECPACLAAAKTEVPEEPPYEDGGESPVLVRTVHEALRRSRGSE
jgi:hypothetical protein